MWPKEHGAYGQLVFPLATAFAVASATLPALLTAVAVTAGFFAHEPFLVLLGRRGVRARRDHLRCAAGWLTASGVVVLVAGFAGVAFAPAPARWAFAFPLVPASVYAIALAAGREKSAIGETAAAAAFSCAAIPVCVVSGAPWATAGAVAVAFGTLFAASTLGVRVIVLRVRSGGNLRAVWITRAALVTVTVGAGAALAAVAVEGILPWTTLIAVAPGLMVSVALAARPPAPKRLRTVGWLLVSISAAAAVILAADLRAP
jgi:YwiC-like protein